MRKSGSASKYTRVVPDIYENSKVGVVGASDKLNMGIDYIRDLL